MTDTPTVGWHADPRDSTVTNYWDGSRWSARKKWTGTEWVDQDAGPPTGSTWSAPVPAENAHGGSGWTKLNGVPAIRGRFSEYGDSVTEVQTGYTWTRYSYIEVGGQVVNRVMVMSGLKSKLMQCLGQDCTLYLADSGKRGQYLIGVTDPNGVTYTSNFPMKGIVKLGTPYLIVLGVLTLPLCGMGLIFFYFAHLLHPFSKAHSLTKRIPNAHQIQSA